MVLCTGCPADFHWEAGVLHPGKGLIQPVPKRMSGLGRVAGSGCWIKDICFWRCKPFLPELAHLLPLAGTLASFSTSVGVQSPVEKDNTQYGVGMSYTHLFANTQGPVVQSFYKVNCHSCFWTVGSFLRRNWRVASSALGQHVTIASFWQDERGWDEEQSKYPKWLARLRNPTEQDMGWTEQLTPLRNIVSGCLLSQWESS